MATSTVQDKTTSIPRSCSSWSKSGSNLPSPAVEADHTLRTYFSHPLNFISTLHPTISLLLHRHLLVPTALEHYPIVLQSCLSDTRVARSRNVAARQPWRCSQRCLHRRCPLDAKHAVRWHRQQVWRYQGEARNAAGTPLCSSCAWRLGGEAMSWCVFFFLVFLSSCVCRWSC